MRENEVVQVHLALCGAAEPAEVAGASVVMPDDRTLISCFVMLLMMDDSLAHSLEQRDKQTQSLCAAPFPVGYRVLHRCRRQ